MDYGPKFVVDEGPGYISFTLLDKTGEPYHVTTWLWDDEKARWKFGFEADIVDVKVL